MRTATLATLLFFLPALAHAQGARSTAYSTYAVEKTFAVNTVDTIYFALPPEFGWTGYPKTDTTTGFNLTTKPLSETVRWNGNAKLSIDLFSGNTADSMRVATFGVTKYVTTDGAQAIVGDTNSLTYLAGSASTYSSVVGNGNGNAFSITGNLDPAQAIGIVVTLGDLVGGSRRFRFALTPQ